MAKEEPKVLKSTWTDEQLRQQLHTVPEELRRQLINGAESDELVNENCKPAAQPATVSIGVSA